MDKFKGACDSCDFGAVVCKVDVCDWRTSSLYRAYLAAVERADKAEATNVCHGDKCRLNEIDRLKAETVKLRAELKWLVENLDSMPTKLDLTASRRLLKEARGE